MNVFAAGEAGALLRYDGTSWLRLNSTTDVNFYGAWGGARSSFLVGQSGAIYRHTR
ncbi:hypothetical protein WMF38_05710 [Sorangium sp. So ce118]